MNSCHSCKKSLSLGRGFGRKDVCPSCGADLYCCLNCRFYDRSASKQCNEPVAENVKEKAKANYCDFFEFSEVAVVRVSDSAEQARKSLDDLFKK